MFFNPPAEGIVDVAVAFSMVQPFDTHFGQAVVGVVVVVLGSTDGLFGLGSAVLVIAVVVPSEMQELVTANQVVVAVVFSVSLVATVLIYVRKFTYSSKKNLNDGARTFDIFLEKRS